MKKTWIKIKRGLLEPKHREALGVRVWLYLYMLDKTNWENGVIQEWTDASAAEELQMPIRTLRDQRRDLDNSGYISCLQKQHYQQITIHNWTNPREYSGDVYNKNTQDSTKVYPKTIQDNIQGDIQGSIKGVTPSLDSQNHILHITAKSAVTPDPDIDVVPKRKISRGERYSVAQAIAEVCEINMGSERNKSWMLKVADDIMQIPTVSDVLIRMRFGRGGDWYKNNWLGRDKNEPPKPEFLAREWDRVASKPEEEKIIMQPTDLAGALRKARQ